jgi:hypothetical protein
MVDGRWWKTCARAAHTAVVLPLGKALGRRAASDMLDRHPGPCGTRPG